MDDVLGGHADKLFLEHLAEPPSIFWTGCHWMLINNLSERGLFDQLRDMKAKGIKNVIPVPLPREFRPASLATEMKPNYLSPQYFSAYKKLVQYSSDLGMKIWLWDEGGWPSGGACGRVVEENPGLAQQSLQRKIIRGKKGTVINVPPDALIGLLYKGNNFCGQLLPDSQIAPRHSNTTVQLFYVKRRLIRGASNPLYPDLLNPAATRKFIELTHEPYRKSIGKYFRNTVCALFTDEPKVASIPWTDDLPHEFRERFGYDILNHLPSLFGAHSTAEMKVRIDFYDWWSDRFSKAFFGQIKKWCKQNNLPFAGHLAGDHITIGSAVCGYGHILRILRNFDIPGVDAIWRELFPMTGVKRVYHDVTRRLSVIQQNHHFPKYASSAAHQQDKRFAMTESGAIYGAGLTMAQMKWLVDYQYVRGINLFHIVAYSSLERGTFPYLFRPTFNNQINPLSKYLLMFSSYVARLSYLLSLGKPLITSAVYYPVRDLWAGGTDMRKVAGSHDLLAKRLLENQCDFDLIDDDVLAENRTEAAGGKLTVGPMKYDTVFISKTRWLSEKAKCTLQDFWNTGGSVFWVGSRRPLGCAFGKYISFPKLSAVVNPPVTVTPSNNTLRICCRDLTDAKLYFITNEGPDNTSCDLQFAETIPIVQIDPSTGRCWTPSHAYRNNNGWEVHLTLDVAGSAVIMFTQQAIPLSQALPRPERPLLAIDSGWSYRILVSYSITDNGFQRKEILRRIFDPIKPGDWSGKVGRAFSGDIEYRVRFQCGKQIVKETSVLDLGRVSYACEATLNGINLGQRAWPPFTFSIAGMVRRGTNDLRVIVTNTMANQFVHGPTAKTLTEKQGTPYHEVELSFEKDSLPSGLFGPVQLLGNNRAHHGLSKAHLSHF